MHRSIEAKFDDVSVVLAVLDVAGTSGACELRRVQRVLHPVPQRARYCSGACRQAAYKHRQREPKTLTETGAVRRAARPRCRPWASCEAALRLPASVRFLSVSRAERNQPESA